MKKLNLSLASLLAFGLYSCVSINPNAGQPPTQQALSFDRTVTKTYSANYLLFLPKDYDPDSSRRWPMILFLHGAGERGSDLELVKKHGPPKIVENKPDFPFIVVSPQCPAGQWWSNDVLLALLEEVTEKHAVDRSRIYLTGLSMGGFGTWNLGLAYPERFAAMAPICGGGDPRLYRLGAERLEALKTMGIWVFHGAKDNVVKLEESEKMVSALKQQGCKAEFTVYPEAGHDSWTETYDNPKLYDWFMQHQRLPR